MVQKIKVSTQQANQRLDRFLRSAIAGLPQALIQKWSRKGNIRLNGKRVKTNAVLQEGDEISLPDFTPEQHETKPKTIPQADIDAVKQMVIFEDDDILVLNKPAGWAVQGGTNMTRHLDHILTAFAEEPPRIVHRLDKDTSGVIVFAKTRQMAQYLTEQFKLGTVEKTYLAIVVGTPDPATGQIEAAIAKRPGKAGEKMEVGGPDALPALTHYNLKSTCQEGLSLLELSPKTGRTHQLRVHCAHMDWPILGDGKYGGSDAHPLPRRTKMMLHAQKIRIQKPFGNKYWNINALLPDNFNRIIIDLFKKPNL